ncbi:hypothetical protein GSS88_05925 [Corynebacterium sp. 3HC-13]|nr:histidine kinase [Corynebacterium poyangense]MBZ8177335.1 hypothetical protein [Corynebacterium poyangense]
MVSRDNSGVIPTAMKSIRRFRLEIGMVICGLALILVTNVLRPYDVNPLSLLFAVAFTAAMALAVRFPLPGALLFLSLFTVVTLYPEHRIAAFTFMAPLLVAVTMRAGATRLAIACAVLLWFLGLIERRSENPFAVDPLPAFIWAGLFVIFLLIGWEASRSLRQRRMLYEQWEIDMRNRRRELAETLHDSVASSLTSIVMRSEALALDPPDTETGQELEDIADAARQSMQEVRALLKILDTEERENNGATETTPPSLTQSVQNAAQKLRTYQLNSHTEISTGLLDFNSARLEVVNKMLNEAALNAGKYAVRRSKVSITVNSHGDYVRVEMRNLISRRPVDPAMSSGLGIPALVQMASNVGGKLSTSSDGETWIIALDVPKEGVQKIKQ